MRPTSKQHQAKDNWASLLQEEIQNAETKFPESAKTAREIASMRKEAGMTYGKDQVQRWIRELIKSGRLKAIDGFCLNENKARVRCVKYVVV